MHPLLLLHGALGSRDQLLPLQQRAGGIAIDLAGHGARELPAEGLRFDQFVDDVERAYEEQGWQQADLFGYSMGGYAAMLFAAKYPERVRSVATLGTKYLWTPEGLQRELRMLDPEAMLAKVPAFAQKLSDTHGEQKWRPLVSAIAKAMSDLAAQPLLTEEVLGTIKCPVLLGVGDRDGTASPEDTLLTARKLKDAGVMVFSRTRHAFEEVDLDLLITQLSRFWEGA